MKDGYGTVHRSADGWLGQPEYAAIEVLDPDGWRGLNQSWYDSITEQDFLERLMRSTLRLPKHLLLPKAPKK